MGKLREMEMFVRVVEVVLFQLPRDLNTGQPAVSKHKSGGQTWRTPLGSITRNCLPRSRFSIHERALRAIAEANEAAAQLRRGGGA